MANLVIPGGRRALPAPLTDAEKQAIADGIGLPAEFNALEARVGECESVGAYTLIHWSETGNDNEDGLTLASSVATYEKVVQLMRAGRTNYLYIDGTVALDHYRNFESPPAYLYILQAAGGAPGKILVKNHTNAAGHCGIWSSGGFTIRCSVLVELDTTSPYGFVNASVTNMNLYYHGGAPTQTVTNTGVMCFLSLGGKLNVFFQSSPIAAIAGRVFYGVAAGVDPNTNKNINTNITAG